MNSDITSTAPFEIRRLFLESETDQIRRMQVTAREFTEHYPRHEEWLDKAITEIHRGERVGFGALEYTLTSPRKPLKVRLVGSIILRENDYSGVIELKNLFVETQARNKGYGTALYKAVELYCRKRGHTTIQTEVPCSELGTISFLHKIGFKVNDREQSPYRSGEDIYMMSKHLTPLYNGDVFDLSHQAVWVLKKLYGLVDWQAPEDNKVYELDVQFGVSATLGHSLPTQLDGIAAIDDGVIDNPSNQTIQLVQKSGKHLRLIFAQHIAPHIRRDLDGAGIKVFDRAALREAFGSYFSYSPPPFDRSLIAGMIVLFKAELFARIVDDHASFTYFKGGPTGKYLQPGHKLILLVEPSAADPTDGVCGLADIRDVKIGSPTDIWNAFSARTPLFTYDQYMRYSAKKSVVVAIEFSAIHRFPPISTEDLMERVLCRECDSEELGHLYIEQKVIDNLLKLRPTNNAKTTLIRKYRVALSFAGEDRHHADKLAELLKRGEISVFYDAHERANLWGKNLYEHLQKVYRDEADFCVIFCSNSYRQKLWTRHELEQAQARAFTESREYVLPVRLDDTPIPGINDTTGFLDLRQLGIQEVYSALLEKLQELG